MPALTTRPLGASGLERLDRRPRLQQLRPPRRPRPRPARSSTPRIDEGVTFLDTADIYGARPSEEYLGEVLQGRRDQVVLATKFGMDMGDGRGPPRLARVHPQRDRRVAARGCAPTAIDYYWYHQPDGVTPIAETLGRAARAGRSAGKVRAIGASNFDAEQLARGRRAWPRSTASRRSSAVQNEYSLLVRDAERDVLPACERARASASSPSSRSPRGLLTGKYRRGEAAPAGTRLAGRDAGRQRPSSSICVEALQGFADERGVPMIDVAIGALLAHDAVVLGDRRRHQARAGARQRRRRPVGAHRGRPGGAGRRALGPRRLSAPAGRAPTRDPIPPPAVPDVGEVRGCRSPSARSCWWR